MNVSYHEWEDSAPARFAAAELGREEVQVWVATVPADEASQTALVCLLSPEERARAARFIVPEPRRQFVYGRALLRQLLGACLRVEPGALALCRAPHGKPCLEQPSFADDLRFNLSHSRSLVAIALARGREVGVDIERIHPLTDWLRLAERIFSPRELGELQALPAAHQQEAFFNGWTRKEAYLKATGEGLTDALSAVEVSLAPGRDARLLRIPGGSEAARRWMLRNLPLPAGFAGAVAFENLTA